MQELTIQVSQTQGSISTNFEQIEAQLKEVLNGYMGIVVTEDTLKESKKDLAELRKIKTSIDDNKKKVKKAWNEPYVEFENKCKELMSLVDEPISEIDGQIKEFEQKRIAEKRKHIEELYKENIDEYERFLPLDRIFNESWLNATSKDKDFLYDLSELKVRVRNDIEAIKNLHSEIEDEVLTAYANAGNNLAAAIQRNTDYLSAKEKAVEKAKVEAREEIKQEIKEEKPSPIQQMNDLIQATKTVQFIVEAARADEVRNFLTFSEITFREV